MTVPTLLRGREMTTEGLGPPVRRELSTSWSVWVATRSRTSFRYSNDRTPESAQLCTREDVGGAFYPVPLARFGQKVRVRCDGHLVRVFYSDTLVAVHARVADGVFAPRAGEAEASTRQQAYVNRLVGQCERVGPALKRKTSPRPVAR